MSARRAASENADLSAAAQRASRGRAGLRGAASSSQSATQSAARSATQSATRSARTKTAAANHPLLLDTHVWVWLLAGDEAFMPANLPVQIENASANGSCYVSDISAWEVATKCERQALSLTMDAPAWIAEAVTAPGLNHVAVSREILVASARLPMDTLPDLVDRILVATALRHGLTIVSADAHLLAFRESWPLFRVIDARR